MAQQSTPYYSVNLKDPCLSILLTVFHFSKITNSGPLRAKLRAKSCMFT